MRAGGPNTDVDDEADGFYHGTSICDVEKSLLPSQLNITPIALTVFLYYCAPTNRPPNQLPLRSTLLSSPILPYPWFSGHSYNIPCRSRVIGSGEGSIDVSHFHSPCFFPPGLHVRSSSFTSNS